MHGYAIETVVTGGDNTIDLCRGHADAFVYFSSSVVAVEFVTYDQCFKQRGVARYSAVSAQNAIQRASDGVWNKQREVLADMARYSHNSVRY